MSASDGDTIIWKLGVSKHPQKRFLEHKVSNPNLLQINALYECKNSEIAYFIEAKLKLYLADFNRNGEWFEPFSLSPELFITYCEMFNEHAISYFEIQKNLKILKY